MKLVWRLGSNTLSRSLRLSVRVLRCGASFLYLLKHKNLVNQLSIGNLESFKRLVQWSLELKQILWRAFTWVLYEVGSSIEFLLLTLWWPLSSSSRYTRTIVPKKKQRQAHDIQFRKLFLKWYLGEDNCSLEDPSNYFNLLPNTVKTFYRNLQVILSTDDCRKRKKMQISVYWKLM